MRASHCLRRDVAGVPVILVTGVQDAAEVRLNDGPNQGATIHDFGDVLQSLADLDSFNGCWDRRKRAQHIVDGHAIFKRSIAFGVKRVRGSHAATHPQQDARICFGLGVLEPVTVNHLRSARCQRCSSSGGQPFDKVTANDCFWCLRIDFKIHGIVPAMVVA